MWKPTAMSLGAGRGGAILKSDPFKHSDDFGKDPGLMIGWMERWSSTGDLFGLTDDVKRSMLLKNVTQPHWGWVGALVKNPTYSWDKVRREFEKAARHMFYSKSQSQVMEELRQLKMGLTQSPWEYGAEFERIHNQMHPDTTAGDTHRIYQLFLWGLPKWLENKLSRVNHIKTFQQALPCLQEKWAKYSTEEELHRPEDRESGFSDDRFDTRRVNNVVAEGEASAVGELRNMLGSLVAEIRTSNAKHNGDSVRGQS